MTRVALWALLVLFAAAPAWAEDLRVQATLDRAELAVGESITLQVRIDGAGQEAVDPGMPVLPAFSVYAAGRSQNITIVNGQVSSTQTFTYMLTARRAGEFPIPPISATVAGRTAESQPLVVKVHEAAVRPRVAPPPPAQRDTGGARDPIFVTASVDRTHPYVGQAVTYLFRFYTTVRVTQPRYAPPDFAGFVSEALPPERTFTATVGGRTYEAIEVRTALFPTSAGPITVAPGRVSCQVADVLLPDEIPDPEALRRLLGTGSQTELASHALRLDVRPLPSEGRPSDFSGAVGRFQVSARLDQATVAAGQPVNLEVEVDGEGNIALIGPPPLPALPGFKAYDPIVSGSVRKTDSRVSGTRRFTVPLVPLHAGTLQVPPVRFSYFDPSAGRYRTLQTNPLRLAVTPGSVALPSPAARPAEEMRSIRTTSALRPARAPLLTHPKFLAAQVLLSIALLAWGAAPNWGQVRIGARRRNGGVRHAVARLRDVPGLREVLLAFLSERLGCPLQGMSHGEVDALLAERGVAAAERQCLRGLLETADTARFAPAMLDAAQARAVLEQAAQLLRDLDSEIPA